MRKRKKKRERESEWEREVREARTEEQIWKIMNRERRKRCRISEEIELEEWDEYFRIVGGEGLEWRLRLGSGRGRERYGGRNKKGGSQECS